MNIPLFKIWWTDDDINRVNSVIRRGMQWAIGPEITEFENKVCQYLGVKYAVAVNSGTSALHAILAAYGIGEGDEVIIPSFTFIATANAPLFVGAKPVFADIENETYGLDPDDVVKKITPKTKAIIPVHYAGCSCRIKELKKIADKHNLILIEDAAEALGSTVNGEKVGSIGDAAILSFCANKVITTGEGGMVLTNSEDIYRKVKLLVSQGRQETGNYFTSTEKMDYVTLGYNFRMSTMTAALGIAQLDKIDEIIGMRRANAGYMTQKLSAIKQIHVPSVPQGYSHIYQLYTIRLDGRKEMRDALISHLIAKGITARIYFDPVHLTKFYRNKFGLKEGLLPITEEVSSQVLTLPMFPGLSKEEIDYITSTISDFFT